MHARQSASVRIVHYTRAAGDDAEFSQTAIETLIGYGGERCLLFHAYTVSWWSAL
jgi:hypothetical protein